MIKQKSVSLIPLSIYFKDSKVKVEIGVGKGKKLYDKREDMAKKDAMRKIDRALKQIEEGKVVIKTMKELEAMTDE